MNEIETMQQRYRALWQKLGYDTPRWDIQTSVRAYDNESFLEFVDGEYRYVTVERGAIVYVRETRDADQMLEWLAQELAGSLARFAVHEEGIDFLHDHPRWRARWIELQLAALETLDPEWARRRKADFHDP